MSSTRRFAGALALGLSLVVAGCGGHSAAKKLPSSFDNVNTGKTRYQMALETDDGSVIELDTGALWAVADADQLVVLRHWSLDSNLVEIGDDGHMLINAEANNTHNVHATRIGTATDHKVYTAGGGAKTLAGIGHGEYFGGAPDGSIITLGDGSVWALGDPTDQETAVDWADGDNIIVTKKATPASPKGGPYYVLDDTDVRASVTATFVGGK